MTGTTTAVRGQLETDRRKERGREGGREGGQGGKKQTKKGKRINKNKCKKHNIYRPMLLIQINIVLQVLLSLNIYIYTPVFRYVRGSRQDVSLINILLMVSLWHRLQ